jgi:hypothetical protein
LLAKQAQGPEFKSQYYQKKKERKINLGKIGGLLLASAGGKKEDSALAAEFLSYCFCFSL